jgi:uncharacterized protein YndB with AHSA1/START domain
VTRTLDELTTPTPTSIRIVRTFDAPVELVWRAHTEPELIKQWMSGPAGHSLVVCEVDFRVGGEGHYTWRNDDFEMGTTIQFEEIVEHERIVYAESYDGWPEGDNTVTATFTAMGTRSSITVEIEYLSQEARDAAMQPGFEEGYAASYDSLDGLLPALTA